MVKHFVISPSMDLHSEITNFEEAPKGIAVEFFRNKYGKLLVVQRNWRIVRS